MIWYLIVCVQVGTHGMTCLPVQEMPSQAACHFVGRKYRSMTYQSKKYYSTYRCAGVKG